MKINLWLQCKVVYDHVISWNMTRMLCLYEKGRNDWNILHQLGEDVDIMYVVDFFNYINIF